MSLLLMVPLLHPDLAGLLNFSHPFRITAGLPTTRDLTTVWRTATPASGAVRALYHSQELGPLARSVLYDGTHENA